MRSCRATVRAGFNDLRFSVEGFVFVVFVFGS